MGAILLKALMSVGTKLFMSMATQEMIEWLLFHVGERLVKSTKTTVDDEFLAELESIYKKHNSL
jgi:alpha-D-ribose 1-methylphosphonate 5-triphosphate synthase subunit PhnH